MKIFDIILEAKQEIYAIGDRHAFAIGKAGGFKNYASSNRSAFSEENISAIEQVPKGSLVVLSAGTEDLAQQNRGSVIQRVEKLIFSLLKKDCQIYYIPPAATDSPSFIGEKNLLRNQLIKQISADMPNIQILDPGALSIKDGDGLTAPGSWYQSVAAKVKGAAKEIKPQSGQAMAPPGKSDAAGGQSSSEFAKDDPRRLDKSADPLGDFITDLEKKKSGEAGQKDQPFMGGQPGYDEAGNKINKDGTPGTTTTPNKNDTPNSAEKSPLTLVVPEKLTGTEIKNLQLALIALGYKVGRTNDDGIYGKNTKAGIEKFQKDNNLTVTGKFDKETVDTINKEIAVLHKKKSEKPPESRTVTLKNKSVGNQHRAGILANIEAESGFIYSDTTGDKGTSWGLFQWNASRRIAMVKAIPDWKTNWQAQIDYALTEDVAPTYLKTDFKSAGEAAMWWCLKWERPFTTDPERQKEEAIKRFKLAKKYL